MAQIATARSAKKYMVEWTTSGSTFYDISGYSTTIAESGGDRKTAEAYTFGDDTAVIGQGKRAPRKVDVSILYVEDTTSYQTLFGVETQATNANFGVRLTPRGKETGAGTITQYTSQITYGVLTALELPTGTPDDGKPMVCKFTLMAPTFTTSTTTA